LVDLLPNNYSNRLQAQNSEILEFRTPEPLNLSNYYIETEMSKGYKKWGDRNGCDGSFRWSLVLLNPVPECGKGKTVNIRSNFFDFWRHSDIYVHISLTGGCNG